MGVLLSKPKEWWYGKTKHNRKRNTNTPTNSQTKLKLKKKPKVASSSSSLLSPSTINVSLFERLGDNNKNSNNNMSNHIDLSNALVSIGLSPKDKPYKPKKNPVQGIREQLKNATTLQDNIKKTALVYSLVPHLKSDRQFKLLFDTLPRSVYAFGYLLSSFNRSPSRVSKASFHEICHFVTRIGKTHRGITFDKIVMLRFRRHCLSVGKPDTWFSVQCIYGKWQDMDTLDLIAVECCLNFSDECLLLTDALGLTGADAFSLQSCEPGKIAKMYDYGDDAAKKVWSLVQVMKQVILHQTRGDHVLPLSPCLT